MKPNLNTPEIKRLGLKCDILFSAIAFKFNLRRYIHVTEWLDSNLLAAGCHTRPLLGST
jgi:hypothetical protein